MNSCTLDTMVVCTFRQANINHKHRRGRLGPGMLVRHYSFPDKDLQRGEPSLTRRNYVQAQRVLTEWAGEPSPTMHAENKAQVGSGEGSLVMCDGNGQRCLQH